MRRQALAAAAVVVGTMAAAAPVRAEPPWIDAAARVSGAVESTVPGADAAPSVDGLREVAVNRALQAARASLVASLAAGNEADAAAPAIVSDDESGAAEQSAAIDEERGEAVARTLQAARARLVGALAAPAPPAAAEVALSVPESFIAAHGGVPVQLAAAMSPAPEPAPPASGEAAARPVRLVSLPMPPEKPWPGVGAPSMVLPHTGLSVRAMPELPRLQPRGSLASYADDRPYAHFDRQQDCIIDHQRFDKQDRRQKFPHVCAPTRDLEVGLPAFTTR
jgi:hypothetical protein